MMNSPQNVRPRSDPDVQAGRSRALQAGILTMAAVVILGLSQGASAADVPVIKGEAGPCSADFTVTDAAGKPLYNANIHVTVRYGFMSKRKSDLEIGTNSDGKARIEGLPEKVKKPLDFQLRHEQDFKSVLHDPASECHANFAVALGSQ